MEGQLLVFIGSLAGVAMLVLAARWLRLGGEATLAGEEDARALADNAICGFTAQEVAMDARGHGALLGDRYGRILLLAPHGVHFSARLLDAGASARLDGSTLLIETGEASFPIVRLDLGDAAGTWSERLSAL